MKEFFGGIVAFGGQWSEREPVLDRLGHARYLDEVEEVVDRLWDDHPNSIRPYLVYGGRATGHDGLTEAQSCVRYLELRKSPGPSYEAVNDVYELGTITERVAKLMLDHPDDMHLLITDLARYDSTLEMLAYWLALSNPAFEQSTSAKEQAELLLPFRAQARQVVYPIHRPDSSEQSTAAKQQEKILQIQTLGIRGFRDQWLAELRQQGVAA